MRLILSTVPSSACSAQSSPVYRQGPDKDEIYERLVAMQRQSPSTPLTHAFVLCQATESQIEYRRNVAIYEDDELSLEQNNAREAILSAMPYSKLGTTWVLVPPDEMDSNDIRCSCITYRREAWVARGTSFRTIPAFYLSSTYTPMVYRKQGNAAALLRTLREKIMAELGLQPWVLFGFSQADQLFASWAQKALAYATLIPPDHCFPALTGRPSEKVRHIYEAELMAVAAADALLLRKEVSDRAAASPDDAIFVVPPIGTDMLYRIAKSRLNLAYRRTVPHADRCGAQIGSPGDPDWAYAVWNCKAHRDFLFVCRLRATTSLQVQTLLSTAQKCAKLWGLTEGVRWSAPADMRHFMDEAGLASYENSDGMPMYRLSSEIGDLKPAIWHKPELYLCAPGG